MENLFKQVLFIDAEFIRLSVSVSHAWADWVRGYDKYRLDRSEAILIILDNLTRKTLNGTSSRRSGARE